MKSYLKYNILFVPLFVSILLTGLIIAIDTTETPIERPKKNKNDITRERKNGIH